MGKAQRPWTMAVVVLLTGLVSAGCASGRMLRSSEASPFIGTWLIAMETPRGARETVSITDADGTVAASVQAEDFPPLEAFDIAKDGDALVLTVERRLNGQPIDAGRRHTGTAAPERPHRQPRRSRPARAQRTRRPDSGRRHLHHRGRKAGGVGTVRQHLR